MERKHGGNQPDARHHGGNQPGEDAPHEKPRTPIGNPRPDVRPGGRKPIKPGPDPDKPGGRY